MNIKETIIAKRQNIHSTIYFICLCLLVIFLPTSRFMLTVVHFILGINWIIEGDFKRKFERFFNNKPALVFVLIYIIHIIGLLWTENLNYAIGSDLKAKLPTLTLTLIMISSSKLSLRQLHLLLFLFISAVLAVTFISFINAQLNDIYNSREILLFSYRLYFNLMLILSMFMLPYLTLKVTSRKIWFIASLVLSLWMLYFLILTKSFSGIISLAGVLVFFALWLIFNHKNMLVRGAIALLLIGSAISITYIISYISSFEKNKEKVVFSELDTHTKEGTPYKHDTSHVLRENGNLVKIYIAEDELREAWNKRSKIDYDSIDKKGKNIKHTIIRYMASKGLRKDQEHFKKLSDEDIKAIEHGTTNYLYTGWPGILERLHNIIRGVHIYKDFQIPEWNTFTKRIDLWRASWVAFKKHPVFGWGTGDIYTAVEYGLEKNDSALQGPTKKPHNQYMLFSLTLGIVGLILFLVFYFYPVIKTGGYKIFPYKVLMIAFFIDMLGNNPLDAYLGQTLFVFFTMIFCFVYPKDQNSLQKYFSK